MTDRSKTQLGYFINFKLWKDALDLLNFQIKQKQFNRHFNTLSMFYYERLNTECLNIEDQDAQHQTYFSTKIASSVFYGLINEFTVFPYVIPKPRLGLRDYKFCTYPMRVVYYAVGLCFSKLSQEFLIETYKKVKTIESFYGGNLTYKDGKLQITSNNIYYKKFYEQFKFRVKEEIINKNRDKFILKLDIENYFNEVFIPKLLNLLHLYIKPSIQTSMHYDAFTKDQITCLFRYIASNKNGIPQSDNNIVSNFIGYLYLVFGDLFIDDILNKYKSVINIHKIIRYTDDIYVSIIFKGDLDTEKQGSLVHAIASQIAETLYTRLGLKLNLKTRLYRLEKEEEKEELLKNIHQTSQNDEYCSPHEEDESTDEKHEENIETPQDKLDKILHELENIKSSRVEDYFIRDSSAQDEILQEVLNKSVEQILDKPENKEKIKQIFQGFKF